MVSNSIRDVGFARPAFDLSVERGAPRLPGKEDTMDVKVLEAYPCEIVVEPAGCSRPVGSPNFPIVRRWSMSRRRIPNVSPWPPSPVPPVATDLELEEGRGISCIECAIEFDNDPDADEAYCPWCGARNPEFLEPLLWLELRAREALRGVA
jgi:hypothetical protein